VIGTPASSTRTVASSRKSDVDSKANQNAPAVAPEPVRDGAERKGGVTDRQRAAAAAAVRALDRMESRVRAGVSPADYRYSLQEARIAFDDAQRALLPGPLLDELRLTMGAYSDAGAVLARLTKAPSVPLFRDDPRSGAAAEKGIIDRYQIKFDQDEARLKEKEFDHIPNTIRRLETDLSNLNRRSLDSRSSIVSQIAKQQAAYRDIQRDIEADTRRAFDTILKAGSEHLANARQLLGD
jgi:hypothetical protein